MLQALLQAIIQEWMIGVLWIELVPFSSGSPWECGEQLPQQFFQLDES